MTRTRALALASASLMAVSLAACDRERKAPEAGPAVAMSETVSDVAASEAVTAVVPSSEASARAPTPAVVRPQATADDELNADEVAAAGDTRRRASPSDAPQ